MRSGLARRNSRQMNCANPSIFEETGEPCHLFAGGLIEHDPWNGFPPGGVSALEQQLDFPVLIPAALVVIFRSAGTRELATNMLLEAQPCGRRREAVAGRPPAAMCATVAVTEEPPREAPVNGRSYRGMRFPEKFETRINLRRRREERIGVHFR